VKRTKNLARVELIESPESDWEPGGPVTSKQEAEITLPRAELERMWTPEHLERLARTYWRWLSKISLGLLRVVYAPDSRRIVFLIPPFTLLRFKKPEYDTDPSCGSVTWHIERGLLVAPPGRGQGFLRIMVRRPADATAEDAEVTLRVSSEVANFYPAIGGWGWFSRIGAKIYRFTQLRIHVIVTNAFLRSLAKLDLVPSKVGELRTELVEGASQPAQR
jgi:hypothetical protein